MTQACFAMDTMRNGTTICTDVLHVLLTGENRGYYEDYAEEPAKKLARGLSEGFIYQDDPSPFRGGARRGSSTQGLSPTAFVFFLQNHDQIGNRALGERLTNAGRCSNP